VREAARLQTFPDEIEFREPEKPNVFRLAMRSAFVAELIANNIIKAESMAGCPCGSKLARYSLVDLQEVQTALLSMAHDETKRVLTHVPQEHGRPKIAARDRGRLQFIGKIS